MALTFEVIDNSYGIIELAADPQHCEQNMKFVDEMGEEFRFIQMYFISPDYDKTVYIDFLLPPKSAQKSGVFSHERTDTLNKLNL